MAEDKLFVEATEEDVPSIIGLRQRIWSTTYRGIYPDSMYSKNLKTNTGKWNC